MTGELRESSDVLGVFDVLRARLKEDGYLFFRSLVPRLSVLEARLEVVDSLRDLGWLSPSDSTPSHMLPRRVESLGPVWPLGDHTVLAGSRSLGLRRHVSRSGAGGAGVDLELSTDDPRWVTTNYLAGEALIFHSFSIHKAAANRGTAVRLSADYRYQAVTEPMTESSLRPFGYPDVPEWEELTRGWSTTRWCEVPASPRVVAASEVFRDFGQPASKL
jgi:hypothetical protein